jgi:hypothetical protein
MLFCLPFEKKGEIRLLSRFCTLDIISSTHNVHQPKYNMYASISLLQVGRGGGRGVFSSNGRELILEAYLVDGMGITLLHNTG